MTSPVADPTPNPITPAESSLDPVMSPAERKALKMSAVPWILVFAAPALIGGIVMMIYAAKAEKAAKQPAPAPTVVETAKASRPTGAALTALDSDDPKVLRAQIAQLQAQLAAVNAGEDGRLSPSPVVSGAFEARLSRLEARQLEVQRAASAILAASSLDEASRSSTPFVAELNALERLAPASPALHELRPLALTGAPSREELARAFIPLAARAAVAARVPEEKDGLTNGLQQAFAGLITFRRVGNLKGDSPDALIARAEIRVAEGNLDAALAEIAALPPKGRSELADWSKSARQRLRIERAIHALRAEQIRHLDGATRPELTP